MLNFLSHGLITGKHMKLTKLFEKKKPSPSHIVNNILKIFDYWFIFSDRTGSSPAS